MTFSFFLSVFCGFYRTIIKNQTVRLPFLAYPSCGGVGVAVAPRFVPLKGVGAPYIKIPGVYNGNKKAKGNGSRFSLAK